MEAELVSDNQIAGDISALEIAYTTDFQKKMNPGLYASVASEAILELANSAEYAMTNVKQTSAYTLAAFLCFTEPTTDGCGHFNDLGCAAVNADCGSRSSSMNNDLASLCTVIKDGEKSIEDGCFIVSLREASDGSSRDQVTPWNSAVQNWVDTHNCTSLMYHLKYRCTANLIKWNDVDAREEYVDLDSLFEATFGITAMSSFNDQKPLECYGLSFTDRTKLLEVAEMQVETAVLSFVTTATSLAHFGVSAADALLPVPSMLKKLRATLLVNLFFDGAVKPLREICCAINACYDYHPLDAFSDKLDALSTFYPGGLGRLANEAALFKTDSSYGKEVLGNRMDAGFGYAFSVLSEAPAKAAWEAASGADIKDIESF